VIQIRKIDHDAIFTYIEEMKLGSMTHLIATPTPMDLIDFNFNGSLLLSNSRTHYHRAWSETSYQLQKLRDNPKSAQQEYDGILQTANPGLNVEVGFDINEDISAPYINVGAKPTIAILREQGVNGQVESGCCRF